jgi:hypothetical protein
MEPRNTLRIGGGAFLKRPGVKRKDILHGYVDHSRMGERLTSLRFLV